jgi:hypothetical protein
MAQSGIFGSTSCTEHRKTQYQIHTVAQQQHAFKPAKAVVGV